MIRVLLADPSERIVGNLTRRIAAEEHIAVAGTAGDGEHAMQEALRLQPDVAVIDASLPIMDGVATTELIAQYLPRTGVIITSLDSERELFRRAMLAGAREVLQKPFKGDDLVQAIERVHDFQRRTQVPSTPPQDSGEAAATGRLFTVLAAKGGVGTSFVSTNLAAALARDHAGGVAIADLSLQYGDVAALLDVKPGETVADLAAHDAVADALVDGPSGLHVLAAPSSPELADYVSSAHVRAALDCLRRSHAIVVADTATQLNEVTLEAVERSDRLILVTDPSVTGVKNTRLLCNVLEVLHAAEDHCVLVVNHRDAPGKLQLERAQIEEFLRMTVALEIPHDAPAVGASLNSGRPLVLSGSQSAAATALNALATLLDTGEAPAATSGANGRKRRGIFGR